MNREGGAPEASLGVDPSCGPLGYSPASTSSGTSSTVTVSTEACIAHAWGAAVQRCSGASSKPHACSCCRQASVAITAAGSICDQCSLNTAALASLATREKTNLHITGPRMTVAVRRNCWVLEELKEYYLGTWVPLLQCIARHSEEDESVWHPQRRRRRICIV